MSKFITQSEVERLRDAAPGSFQKKLYEAMRERTLRNTRAPGFVQPGDTQEWWHLCWERASDAAFVWHMERDEALGAWIRGCALYIANLPEDTWIGPWFRERKPNQRGMLETAHIALALCEFIDLAEELFAPDEMALMKTALEEKGLKLCRRFCETSFANNWFMVLLNGFTVAAVILEKGEDIAQALRWMRSAHNLFNDDSYGESLQYSNYAALSLCNAQEVLLRYDPSLESMLDMTCYAHLMPWYAASMLYMKPLTEGGEPYPRVFNLGDCAAIFRPTGDLLVQVAMRMAARLPRQARLATWLFETCYADPALGPDELATFGFFNHFSYYSVLMQPDMIDGASPDELGYPTVMDFDVGHVIARDKWEGTRMALAFQAGYKSLNVTAHRHQDQLSIQLAIGRERMLIDAGHTCYRLAAHAFSTSSAQHNVFDFVRADGSVIGQQKPEGNYIDRQPPLTKTLMKMRVGAAEVIVADAAAAYGAPIRQAIRAVVFVAPNACFVIDRVVSDEPVIMRDHFALNNRDNRLKEHRVSNQRFVFRRGGEAMKLFECGAWLDGVKTPSKMRLDWGYVHDHYHPLPNQEGQGRDGSALIYSWDSPALGCDHIRVTGMAMDCDESIKKWHILMEDDQFVVDSPAHEAVLSVRVSPGSRRVYLVQNGEETLLF